MPCTLFPSDDPLQGTACFTSNQLTTELYLNCASKGVINIHSAIYGILPSALLGTCPPQTEPSDCWTQPSPSTMQNLYGRCMGKTHCTVTVPILPIDACSDSSNFFQATYSCIPSENTIHIYSTVHVH